MSTVDSVVKENRPESLKICVENARSIIRNLGYNPEDRKLVKYLAHDPLPVWWSGTVEGDIITYTPYIPIGNAVWEMPEEIALALFAEVGANPIRVKLETEFVIMPMLPVEWRTVGEYWVCGKQVSLPEARVMALNFVDELRKMGLID